MHGHALHPLLLSPPPLMVAWPAGLLRLPLAVVLMQLWSHPVGVGEWLPCLGEAQAGRGVRTLPQVSPSPPTHPKHKQARAHIQTPAHTASSGFSK